MAHRHPTVLLINDTADISDALAELLRGRRYTVETAENGQEALALLHAGLHPCIILLDLMMPVMNGFEFRDHQLRIAEFADIPVIVFSAITDAGITAAHLNAAAYVQLPTDTNHLLDQVERHCLK